ncbi:hypothetical protein [Flavobacterium sp.]|uniref:hypothetical protein n=1 Tax=Flavobacterium sp. TaxID=239 RepID=UPI002B4B3525|nr:hypothetical protein [Flavobacterium sp.]HLF52785.1 hypothetical protein [Flavobacterium sp.]
MIDGSPLPFRNYSQLLWRLKNISEIDILIMSIDYSTYPKNWKTEIRPAILKRDENCCKFCGIENGSLIHRFGKGKYDFQMWPEGMLSEAWDIDGKKCTKIVLTIAHLDHDKTNNCYENLAALCQKCHLTLDINQHKTNRKYGRNWKRDQHKLDI